MQRWVVDKALDDGGDMCLRDLVKNSKEQGSSLLVMCLSCAKCSEVNVCVYRSDYDDEEDWFALYLRESSWVARDVCEECDDDGNIESDCSDCDGSGTVPVTCGDCDGSGRIDCEPCSGEGKRHSECGELTSDGCECDHEDENHDCEEIACVDGGCKINDCDECDEGRVDCENCEEGKANESCEECSGSGRVHVKCSVCDGDGVVCPTCVKCSAELEMNHRNAQVVVARGDVHVRFPPPVASLKVPLFTSVELLYDKDEIVA